MRPLWTMLPALALLSVPLSAEDPEINEPPRVIDPLELGKIEKATVRLVLLDVVVVDKKGRAVPDLTAEDFEVQVGRKRTPIDTLDVGCPSDNLDDPREVRRASARRSPEDAARRRIVFAFDYLHMAPFQREDALTQAKELLRGGGTGQNEIMVAALTGGLRIEQTFSGDSEQVLRSLERMEYDISLWNQNFSHMNEFGFVEGLTSLFDVLGTVPGPKAVVLFSGMEDVPMDLQFQQLAAIATTSRCSIYPVDVSGLPPPDMGFGVQPAPG